MCRYNYGIIQHKLAHNRQPAKCTIFKYPLHLAMITKPSTESQSYQLENMLEQVHSASLSE